MEVRYSESKTRIARRGQESGNMAVTRMWAQSDYAELNARITAGEDIPAIAKAMGRSQEAVRKKIQLLELSLRRI